MTINGFHSPGLFGMLLLLLQENSWELISYEKGNLVIRVRISPQHTLIFQIG